MRYTFFCWWISSKQDLYLVFLLNNPLSKTFAVFLSFVKALKFAGTTNPTSRLRLPVSSTVIQFSELAFKK